MKDLIRKAILAKNDKEYEVLINISDIDRMKENIKLRERSNYLKEKIGFPAGIAAAISFFISFFSLFVFGNAVISAITLATFFVSLLVCLISYNFVVNTYDSDFEKTALLESLLSIHDFSNPIYFNDSNEITIGIINKENQVLKELYIYNQDIKYHNHDYAIVKGFVTDISDAKDKIPYLKYNLEIILPLECKEE